MNEFEKRRGLEPPSPFSESPFLGRMLPQEPIGPLEAKGSGGGKKGHSKPEVSTQTKVNFDKSKGASTAADIAQGQRKG